MNDGKWTNLCTIEPGESAKSSAGVKSTERFKYLFYCAKSDETSIITKSNNYQVVEANIIKKRPIMPDRSYYPIWIYKNAY